MKNQNQFNVKPKSSIRRLAALVWLLIAAFAAAHEGVQAQALRPQIVSRSASGSAANEFSQNISTSADGRYLVFESTATNLIDGLADANNRADVFLLDTQTNQLRCLSLAAPNTTGDGGSGNPIVSPDGRYVVFFSSAGNLTPNDTNNEFDVFRFDTATGEILMVSRNAAGNNGGNNLSGASGGPEIKAYDMSDDGRYVAFSSLASNLTAFTDTNNGSDVFVRDMQTGTTFLVTIARGTANAADNASYGPNISSDGKYVSFVSLANNLILNLDDGNGFPDVFVKNMETLDLRCATMSRRFPGSTASNGGDVAVMSKNGTRIVFYSISPDLVPNEPLANIFQDAYVYDMGLGIVSLVSVNAAGSAPGNAPSGGASDQTFISHLTLSITPDGRYVAFESRATDLVTGITDNQNFSDVFRRDLTRGVTEIVSVSRDGTRAGDHSSVSGARGGAISRDGRVITFTSRASNLISESLAANFSGIFARDMNLGTTFLLSLNVAGNSHGNGENQRPIISQNGRTIVFQTFASDLTANDANGTSDVFRARFPVPQAAISDFDGDGKSDPAVFRPSSGVWYALPSNGFVNLRTWGQSGDLITPADYDGDGKTDHAVFRASEGNWYLQYSTGIFSQTINFGLSGDVPVPADYDGDGKSDIAVFRPANGTWYILQSSNGQVRYQTFGLGGDQPALGDYDGDSEADLAVFRPSDRTWYILKSSDNSFAYQTFGLSADRVAPADFDGDGRTDVAVFRASEGKWYILRSRTMDVRVTNFGLADDRVVPADYDGDGRADIAVFRPSSGDWYVLRSTDGGVSGLHWGLSGDVPVPAAFVR